MDSEIALAVGFAAGATVGAVADRFAIERQSRVVEEEHLPVLASALSHEQNEDEKENQDERSAYERARAFLGRYSVKGAVILSFAVSGSLFAYSFTGESSHTNPEGLEIVADGAADVQSVLPQEVSIISDFSKTNPTVVDENLSGVHSDNQQITTAREFAKFVNTAVGEPLGAADMNGGIATAQDLLDKQAKSSTNTAGEILVITNGDSLGDTASLAQAANQQKTKVSVVNLDPRGTPKQLVDSFQGLASSTGGQYFSRTTGGMNLIAERVNQPTTTDEMGISSETSLIMKGLAAILFGTGSLILANRRRFTTGKGMRG
ncbi:MAG TPA: hypothetical protein VL989_01215 [Candidatus Sulfotelmatobacter sp.]|nr:hypothetical protein [Candidatus Sulfotelmatobacter sp.]